MSRTMVAWTAAALVLAAAGVLQAADGGTVKGTVSSVVPVETQGGATQLMLVLKGEGIWQAMVTVTPENKQAYAAVAALKPGDRVVVSWVSEGGRNLVREIVRGEGEKKPRAEGVTVIPPVEVDRPVKEGPRDGERVKEGPRDGERVKEGARDGEKPREGSRDGEAVKVGPRDGERVKEGARDGEGAKVGARDAEKVAREAATKEMDERAWEANREREAKQAMKEKQYKAMQEEAAKKAAYEARDKESADKAAREKAGAAERYNLPKTEGAATTKTSAKVVSMDAVDEKTRTLKLAAAEGGEEMTFTVTAEQEKLYDAVGQLKEGQTVRVYWKSQEGKAVLLGIAAGEKERR